MQHLPKVMARLIAQVQPLPKLGPPSAIHGADVLDNAVDTRPEWRAARQRGDADRCLATQQPHGVDDEHLHAERVAHGRRRHGEKADGGFGGVSADDEFEHDTYPGNGEVPVEEIELFDWVSDCAHLLRFKQEGEVYVVSSCTNHPAIRPFLP